MEIFGGVHVWISDEKIAHDLLSKRNAIYSDRPVIHNLPDNRTSGEYLALLGRTGKHSPGTNSPITQAPRLTVTHKDTWKRQRKLCHHLMTASDRDSLHGYPTRERDRFLYLMSQDSGNYIEWVEQFTSRTVSRLSWGSPHPAQVLRKTTHGLLQTISPSGALPNVINWLAHVPAALSPWKKRERERHALEKRLFENNMGFVERMRGEEKARPSFVGTFLEDKEREKRAVGTSGDEKSALRWAESGKDEAMYVVGLMAIAGALTIGSPVQSYLLAMCHYPESQRKLQEEIDTACEGRCPQWEDREKLPMLRAVVKEVMRWRPPVPTGIPHAVEQDDVYNGYFIPAGATIHALEWSAANPYFFTSTLTTSRGITRNEETYPDAETFNPDRWLSPAFPTTYREPLTQYPNLNGYSQFGFGRRTCQGVPIVEQDLFLAMGGMAWAFSIQKKRDPATGDEVPVHWDTYTPLLIAKPAPFVFDAVPRGGPERQAELRRMWEGAKEEDEELVLEEDGSLNMRNMARSGRKSEGDESESDHDVLIDVKDSSAEPSESGR